jgi:hypothetical protein
VVVGLADNLGEFELTRPALNGVSWIFTSLVHSGCKNLSFTMPALALGPTQSLILRLPEALTVTEIGHGGKRRELECVELYCHFSYSSTIKRANSSLTILFIPISQIYRKKRATCFGLLTSGLAHNNTKTKSCFLLPVPNHVPRCEDPRGKGDITRTVRKVFSHFVYLENLSLGLNVTWLPVRGDLTAPSWTVTLPWG